MGRPKAWLPWRGGRPLVACVVETLRTVADEVVVVASADLELPPLDARVVRDREPGLGPLAGIREGLAAIDADLAFVTGTDAPFLSAPFARALLRFGTAAAPEIGGHVQVLAAVYPREALAAAERLLAQEPEGRRRPLALLEAVGYRRVSPGELPGVADVRGFNTPAEYLTAVRESFAGATATVELRGRVRRTREPERQTVPVGTLAEVLAHAGLGRDLCVDGRVGAPYRVSLPGCDRVRDARVPVGPGERVIVGDALAGAP